ncbi:MAG: hypothetical protein ACK5AZ_26665 [Bryobacteraceae bacterium]
MAIAEILQHAFFPSLERSWPPLNLFSLKGNIGDAILTAPGMFRFDRQDRQVLFADEQGNEPPRLTDFGYDLCIPMTSIPLDRLRREFELWRTDRRYRCLGMLPVLLPEAAEHWAAHASKLKELFAPIEKLYTFDPALDLWFKPFADWTEDDWNRPDHRSYLWDIPSGKVLTAPGLLPRKEIENQGQPYAEYYAEAVDRETRKQRATSKS